MTYPVAARRKATRGAGGRDDVIFAASAVHGDMHRENLEGVLKRLDPDILVVWWTRFYAAQYRLHVDRD